MSGGTVALVAMILCGACAVGIVAMIPVIAVAGMRGHLRRALHLTAALVGLLVVAAFTGTVVGASAEAYLAV